MIDKDLFEELTSNSDPESTEKSLLLLRHVVNEGVDLFPELTSRQAKKWLLNRTRSDFDRRKLNGLLGLLANKDKRMKILGF